MGNPLHYSLVPQRCVQLIDELWPHAKRTQQADQPELGSLTTTFLISMSMPVVNLPVERMERHKDALEQGYADDRHIDPKAAEAIATILGGQELRKAPFYFGDAWSFATCAPLNIAHPLPDDLAAELGTKDAMTKASKMPTSQWCSILRNSMAHGGIAYLDETGRSSYGQPVSMYAFVSGKFDEKRKLTAVNVLRISEVDYRIFLRKWVEWLLSSGLGQLAA
jgi:hypothetical protein